MPSSRRAASSVQRSTGARSASTLLSGRNLRRAPLALDPVACGIRGPPLPAQLFRHHQIKNPPSQGGPGRDPVQYDAHGARWLRDVRPLRIQPIVFAHAGSIDSGSRPSQQPSRDGVPHIVPEQRLHARLHCRGKRRTSCNATSLPGSLTPLPTNFGRRHLRLPRSPSSSTSATGGTSSTSLSYASRFSMGS